MHQWCRDGFADMAANMASRRGGAPMITVGKVRDADYYLVEVTSDDAHAYYADPERRGRWHGSFADELGLTGEVGHEEFRELLAGKRPGVGTRLAETRVQVTALDVTLSVPKSVSMLWATSGAGVQAGIEQALDGAERSVVELIESEATFVRRGHGGAQLFPGTGVAVPSFDHRTSRLGDPNLHRHLVVANATKADDGRITGLDTSSSLRSGRSNLPPAPPRDQRHPGSRSHSPDPMKPTPTEVIPSDIHPYPYYA